MLCGEGRGGSDDSLEGGNVGEEVVGREVVVGGVVGGEVVGGEVVVSQSVTCTRLLNSEVRPQLNSLI